MAKIQQSYSSLPQQTNSQRLNGKSTLKSNNIQMKINTLKPNSTLNLESFENLNRNVPQTNYA